jgi:hypothetical protein
MKAANPNFFPSLCITVGRSLTVIGLGAATLLSPGCGKKKPAEKSPTTTAETTTLVPATTPLAGPPVAQRPPVNQTTQVITPDANTEVVLEKLSMELRRYVAYTRTIPKTFEEFAAHNTVQFPPAPAGKKYAIQQGKVILQSK